MRRLGVSKGEAFVAGGKADANRPVPNAARRGGAIGLDGDGADLGGDGGGAITKQGLSSGAGPGGGNDAGSSATAEMTQGGGGLGSDGGGSAALVDEGPASRPAEFEREAPGLVALAVEGAVNKGGALDSLPGAETDPATVSA